MGALFIYAGEGALNKLVDQILQELLPAALVRFHLAQVERVLRKLAESHFAFLDLLSNPEVERAVTLANKLIQAPIFADGGGDL